MAGPTKAQFSSRLGGSASWFEAITKSDSTVFAQPTSGLYIGGVVPVDVAVVGAGPGQSVVFPDLLPGMIHPISCTQVRATGTVATEVVGIWVKR